jgi:hypothetical protein
MNYELDKKYKGWGEKPVLSNEAVQLIKFYGVVGR